MAIGIVGGVLFPARNERYVRAGLLLSFAQAIESKETNNHFENLYLLFAVPPSWGISPR